MCDDNYKTKKNLYLKTNKEHWETEYKSFPNFYLTRTSAALAISLKSASSKFRNDIIEVIIVTYRLKG